MRAKIASYVLSAHGHLPGTLVLQYDIMIIFMF